MGKLGERHEADALIGILLEYRNLVAGLAAELAERLASSSDRRRMLKLAEAWVELHARDGGLLSYGVDRVDLFRRAASYVDRILRGAKPSELPVQLPTKFEMVVNLKAAKSLGLTVPQSILLTADEVIE